MFYYISGIFEEKYIVKDSTIFGNEERLTYKELERRVKSGFNIRGVFLDSNDNLVIFPINLSNFNIKRTNKCLNRVAEVNTSTYGQKMMIIAYRYCDDIDIIFEDGTTVYNKSYKNFIKGNIGNPAYLGSFDLEEARKHRLHSKRTMNNGLEAEIIEYRNSQDIDVRFENGVILRNVLYDKFNRGTLSYDNFYRDIRLSEKRVMNNGLIATIVDYNNNRNVTVEFEDGFTTKTQYNMFINGKVSHPDYKTAFINCKKRRLGMKKRMNNGLEAEIVEYRGTGDIDIKFEDGYIATGKNISDFLRGRIGNPNVVLHRSVPEKIVAYFISQYFDIQHTYKADWLKYSEGTNCEIDIWIPELKIGVEYDGFYHSSHKGYQRDVEKNQIVSSNCAKINKLIRIREQGLPILPDSKNVEYIDLIDEVRISTDIGIGALEIAINEVLKMLGVDDADVKISSELIDL